MLRTDQDLQGTESINVGAATRRAHKLGLFDALARVYAELPETKCPRCARCCFESPGMFLVEHLRLAKIMAAMPRPRRHALGNAAWRELLFSWIEPERTCIFLDNARLCTIYAHRPLTCRIFGLFSPADPKQAQIELRLAAEQEARQLRLFGLEIPEATLGRAIASCCQVETTQGLRPKVDPDAIAERIADIDAELIPREVVMREYCFLSLPDRLGRAAFGDEAVETLRIQVLRRALRGEPLASLVDMVQQQTRRPAACAGKDRK
jgi:Fe-S-cluster containining protein